MATFVLIHGAGDVGWYWHLVESSFANGVTTWWPWLCHAMPIRRG